MAAISGVINFGQAAHEPPHWVAQLPIVGECLREDFKASQIKEADENSGQVGCRLACVCARAGAHAAGSWARHEVK